MKTKLNSKLNIKWEFLVLLIASFMSHAIYFRDVYIPSKDSMYVFQVFYYFYNELFFHGDLAQWMPYYSYGLPTNYHQLVCFTPVSYLAFLLGWIFKVTNVLLLFKISMLGEQLVFLTGMYLLSRHLFKERTTIFLVCLGAIASSYWYESIYFHFRLFYLFPFVVYFLLLFFKLKKPPYFWLAALTAVAWLMGVPPYFVSLWFYVLLAVFLPLIVLNKDSLRHIFKRSTIGILLFLALVVLCFSYFYQLRDIQAFVDIAYRRSLKNNWGMFLTYGAKFESQGHFERGHFLNTFLLGQTPQVYIGLLPIIFYFWALIRERSKIFFAFLSVAVALIWLSLSGVFSIFCYFLPGLSYYRHIDVIYLDGFIKVLILLCAGFGCEHFLKESLRVKVGFTAVVLLGLVFVLDSSRITADVLYALWMNQTPSLRIILAYAADVSSALFRIGAYSFVIISLSIFLVFVWRFKKGKNLFFSDTVLTRIVNTLFVVILVVDVVSFQYSTYKKSFKLLESHKPLLYVFQVHKMEFQKQRRSDPELTEYSFFARRDKFQTLGSVIPLTARQTDAYEVIGRWDKWATSGTEAYGFLQLDPCYPQFRTDFLPKRISTLLNINSDTSLSTLLDRQLDLYKIMGCNHAKLKLVSQAVFADTDDDTKEKVYRLAKMDDAVVLKTVTDETNSISRKESMPSAEGEIHIKAFTANKLIADVDVLTKGGVWLYYSDSYHPDWQATVNGKKAPIYEANLAFKTIYLAEGKNIVQFVFHNGFSLITSHVIALFGLAFSVVLCFMLFRLLFFNDDPFAVIVKDKAY